MKKVFVLFTVILLIFSTTFSLVACGNDEIDDLKQTVEDLKSQVLDLKTRVEKLETSVALISTLDKRISALEKSGIDAQEYAQLKSQVETLQTALTDNSASDSEVKTQVTEMQLVLNKIYGTDGSDGVLEEIQNSLNTLYGEVDRVQQFENGKEYEVKLNGVVYYTVSVIVEYHNGIVQSEQDIIKCKVNGLHWCASVKVTNKMFDTITSATFGNMMRFIFDDTYIRVSNMNSKEGVILPEEQTKLKHNESIRWYFIIGDADYVATKNLKLSFSLNVNPGVRILILDNVWDGVQEPIQGEKL